MGQGHTWRDLFPARIVCQILVWPVLVRENRIGAVARQGLVEIVLDGCIEVDLALINQLHHRVSKHGLGDRRTVHDSVCRQRISLGVTDAVGMDIADLAVIDDRDGHSLGVGMGHDTAHFSVDGGAVGYCLCDCREGKAEGRKKHSQKRKNLFPRAHAITRSELGPASWVRSAKYSVPCSRRGWI